MCTACGQVPLISVIMGVRYRRRDTALLERSVDSILAQTVTDFEFLICDDGSSQEARTVLETKAKEDGRIRLLRGVKKLDLASKLNACLGEAKGALIARMDDDDYSSPDRLQKQVATLENHPEIAFVGCAVRLVRAGKLMGERQLPEYPKIRDFYMVQPFVHPTLLFRREPLRAAGGYSEGKRQVLCEDYDLLLRLYGMGYYGMNLQEPLLEYTIPVSVKGRRTMVHRWNETATRFARFRELGALPEALPYVIKPLAVGLIPEILLKKIKQGYS